MGAIVVDDAVARRWGWAAAACAPLAGGLINHTFRVDDAAGHPLAVLQRLHPIFGPTVQLDLDAVTRHLAARGLETPRPLATTDGALWAEVDGHVWRALSWVDGEVVAAVPAPAWAEAGGALVGRFHRAVDDLQHTYAHVRAGVHDTAAHLGRLRDAVAAAPPSSARDLGEEILAAAAALPPLPPLRTRHCHGDLKISNLMFAPGRPATAPVGRCLLDLDTLGLGTLAFELGDAMRSWCNPRGEDVERATFELPIFAAAMRGYLEVAGELASADERAAVVAGLQIVCVELAARFCVDVFEDRYFGWDPSRYPSRRAHNEVRARGQLALATSVRAQRADALAIALAGA